MELNPTIKVGSDDLKTLALCWLRFMKGFDLVCTEDPSRSADAIGTDSSIQCRKLIEIETKVSIPDLKADKNKWSGVFGKHERLSKTTIKDDDPQYEQVHGTRGENKDHSVLPTQFYFMVPKELKDEALIVIEAMYPHAGLMTGTPFTEGYFGKGGNHVVVVKKAPVLHRLLIAKHIKGGIAARMSSEICKIRLDLMRDRWSNKP